MGRNTSYRRESPRRLIPLVLAGVLALPLFLSDEDSPALKDRVSWSAPDGQGTRLGSLWLDRALDRERGLLTARLAARYSVPVGLADRIHQAATEEGVDPELAFGLVQTESSFRRTVVSSAGAVGYTQLLPSTAGWLVPGVTRRALFDPDTNLRTGFRYLRYLIDRYEGDVETALTAYNRGPGTVDRLLRLGRSPDNGYAGKVLQHAAD